MSRRAAPFLLATVALAVTSAFAQGKHTESPPQEPKPVDPAEIRVGLEARSVDTPLNPDPKVSRSVAVFDVKDLKAVIKDAKLITPTGHFNLYNTQHDIY